ncbi:MAG: hypothetical protein ACR2H1_05590 [Limisphaerales bacterium]
MITTVDERHRLVLKKFSKGDVLLVDDEVVDEVRVRRMKPAEKKYKPRLVRRNGRLIVVGGKPITNEDVRNAIEDDL